MNRIAVLLTCHNRKDKTLSCLQNLFSSDVPVGYKIDVHLVDDGSLDGTGDCVREKFPSVHVYLGNGNLYWAGGMRRAWSEASKFNYDYYLWLNDDSFLYPDFLSKLLKTAETAESLIIVAGTMIDPKDKSKLTYGGYDHKWNLINPHERPISCSFFNGNCVLVPRSVYEIVGNLDVRFTHSLGDFDYGIRARKLGISLKVAQGILGECESHDNMPRWCRNEGSVRQRLEHLYSPLGCHPFEFFLFSRRQKGFVKAVSNFITLHLRAIFPFAWRRKEHGK